MLRVPMLAATEFESYGLKSCENVTPVVGSAISGLPPDAVALLLDCWHAVNTIAVTPSNAARDRNFMGQSPPCCGRGQRRHHSPLPPTTEGNETPTTSSLFLTSFVSHSRAVLSPEFRFRWPAARPGRRAASTQIGRASCREGVEVSVGGEY